ncbi:hypothetical protein LWC34_54610 [Kibdelosporangium philippinense]|uniref:Uncharacterized protein n=1 Tax=Kibdelosporangium philippinense TaxID=211113 RepID=A0ABS8ZVR0_9PSEU|nr:hypothetical protein [Kibdelosporangium philippinense]MCE7011792.1 hypothetical protein [Kibdelosporangium philippinense]
MEPRRSGDGAGLDQQGFAVGKDELLERGRLQVDRRQIVPAQVNAIQRVPTARRVAELRAAAG